MEETEKKECPDLREDSTKRRMNMSKYSEIDGDGLAAADQQDLFTILRLSREDIKMMLSDMGKAEMFRLGIGKNPIKTDDISDDDMRWMARKLGDCLMEYYWESLKQVFVRYVEIKKER